MRKVLLLLIILLESSTVILSQSGLVKIDGQIIGYKGSKRVEYGIFPTWGSGNNGSVQPDSLGRFTIQKSIRDTEYFFMYYSENGVTHTCKLIIRPGEYYSFFSIGQDSKEWKTHYSPDIYKWEKKDDNPLGFYEMHPGQMYFNKIDNGTSGSLYHDDWDLFEPDSLLYILHLKIKAQISIFQNLMEESIIDKEYYEIAKRDIEYTQAYRLAQTISDTWRSSSRYGIEDSVINNKLYKVYQTIFEQFPVKGVKMEYHFGFDRYLDQYLRFYVDYNDGKYKPHLGKKMKLVELMPIAKDVLSEDAYKTYKMAKTMSYVGSLNLEAKQYADDFLIEYPDMKDTPEGEFLKDVLIPNYEEFMKLAKKENPEEVIILDRDSPITSYPQLLDVLKGKPLLIDYWGIWCLPCRYQFRYNDTLKPFLEKYGIEMVYIAYEYQDNREQWEAFINAYNLTGYHLMSNDDFRSDFEKYAGRLVQYPTYIIVDREGNIIEPNAYFPSQGEKFYNQIKEKLKL